MDNGVYVIRDAGSTNGTFVAFNGEPAQERQIERNALRDGSLIRLGNVRLTFRVGWDAD
jgi:pSer/pThr/pTyr-binding forkhead associated (FHA) protein